MRKILTLLGTIALIGTSTTSLVACNKIDNIENKEDNKPKPWNPQEPPENSNWKLMPKASSNRLSHPNYLNIADNMNYIFIYNNYIPENYKIVKIINDGFKIGSNIYKFVGEHIIRPSSYWNAIVKSSYQWNGQNEPETPTINKDTGEITDWK